MFVEIHHDYLPRAIVAAEPSSKYDIPFGRETRGSTTKFRCTKGSDTTPSHVTDLLFHASRRRDRNRQSRSCILLVLLRRCPAKHHSRLYLCMDHVAVTQPRFPLLFKTIPRIDAWNRLPWRMHKHLPDRIDVRLVRHHGSFELLDELSDMPVDRLTCLFADHYLLTPETL